MKANFPARFVGRVTSNDDARVAAVMGGTGAEKLSGRRDFVLVVGGQIIRFQAAQIRLEEIAAFFAPRTTTQSNSWATHIRRIK